MLKPNNVFKGEEAHLGGSMPRLQKSAKTDSRTEVRKMTVLVWVGGIFLVNALAYTLAKAHAEAQK